MKLEELSTDKPSMVYFDHLEKHKLIQYGFHSNIQNKGIWGGYPYNVHFGKISEHWE